MTKNVIIAVLVGIIIGQTCKADTTINNAAITRKDLFYAAALCGELARGTLRHEVVTGAKNYADKFMQDIAAAQ